MYPSQIEITAQNLTESAAKDIKFEHRTSLKQRCRELEQENYVLRGALARQIADQTDGNVLISFNLGSAPEEHIMIGPKTESVRSFLVVKTKET